MVVVLTGKNGFGLSQYLYKLTKDFSAEFGSSIEHFDGTELNSSDSVLDAVRSLSFLEPKKMVIVRDFSACSDLMNKIESIVEQTADSTDLVLVDPKLDKRTAAFKYLKENCSLQSFDELQPYELEKWLTSLAKELKTEIEKKDAEFLINRVGPNQQLLDQEMTKLAYSGKKIDNKLIQELIEPTPQSKVFDLLSALFEGESKKAYELYQDQRSQGEEPQKLIAMITWQLQQLTYAVYSPVKSVDWLVNNVKMSSYSARKALELSKNITKSDLKFYITELAEIDNLSKTSADVESALAVYFSEVSFAKAK